MQIQKINYDDRWKELIAKWQMEKKRPRILLHSCCAPCSTYVIKYLSLHSQVTVYYANPNIHPKEEYLYRKLTQKKFIRDFNLKTGSEVEFLDAEYEPELFFKRIKGWEEEPEGGKRCGICFRLRLELTAQKAKEGGYDYFATTLTVSAKKNAELINQTGFEIQEESGAAYLPSDFKKCGGYLQSVLLSKEYGLYRQHFCGCIYALKKQGLDLRDIRENAIHGTQKL